MRQGDSVTEVEFFGDTHSDYRAVAHVLSRRTPKYAVFLGDFDLARPLHEELSELEDAGVDIRFVHGNHETDTDDWYDRVFGSRMAGRNISGKVAEMGGIRVAGLGGVFRGAVWNPREDPVARHGTRESFLRHNPGNRWRGGLPRRHRSTIFPEDLEALTAMRADILVTHEAPSSHRFGFREIDALALSMGVSTIVHGHHHEAYDAVLPGGIRVVGMGLADSRTLRF
jgi:predicted phosphodiesterase